MASDVRQNLNQKTMTLGKPSNEIFLPALPKIGSQNDYVIRDTDYSGSLSPSPDEVGRFMEKTDSTSSGYGKRVRFSQPLEFWKEFDRDSGQLLDDYGDIDEPVKETDENTKESKRKSHEEKVSKKLNERRGKRRGKARVVARTITEAVESLNLEDEKTSVRKFIAHYKRSTACDFRLQNKPRQRGNICEQFNEEENQPNNDVISHSHQHDNNATKLCKICKFRKKTLAFDSKANRTKVRSCKEKRASSLPSVDVNGRKLFEERLLPDDFDDKFTLKNNAMYGGCLAGFREGTSVTYLKPTPLIVQLFD